MNDQAPNNQTSETELPTYAANQKEAAETFEMTAQEFEELKKSEGFPAREPKGWNIDAIKTWIESAHEGEGESGGAGEKPPSPPSSRPASPSLAPSPPLQTVIIEIPICEPPEGSYIGQGRGHIDCRLDRETQLPAFQQIHAGLRAANATLPNGKPVESAADVVRYLAALVASELETES